MAAASLQLVRPEQMTEVVQPKYRGVRQVRNYLSFYHRVSSAALDTSVYVYIVYRYSDMRQLHDESALHALFLQRNSRFTAEIKDLTTGQTVWLGSFLTGECCTAAINDLSMFL